MSTSPLTRLRRLCLSLPETTEKVAWGSPTFRVRNKMFAMFHDNHHGDGRIAVWLNAAPGAQDVLIGAEPGRFFVPPYMGPSGWIGVRLDNGPDWGQVAALVEDAFRIVAPKRVAALLDPD